MPNWCENNVTIGHKLKRKLITLAKECMKDECRLFNLILPQPDWMTTSWKGMLPKLKDIKNKKGELIMQVKEFPDGTIDERWYDWNCENWGCKWDIGGFYQDSFPIDYHGEDRSNIKRSYNYELNLNFDTAWSPPIGVYNALVNQGYYVVANYIEGGSGYCGEYDNGSDTEYSFNDSDVPLKFKEQIQQWRAED